MASEITGVSIAQSFDQAQIKGKKPKLRVIGLCEGNPLVTGGFPSQRASDAENASICWRHHAKRNSLLSRMLKMCTSLLLTFISYHLISLFLHTM